MQICLSVIFFPPKRSVQKFKRIKFRYYFDQLASSKICNTQFVQEEGQVNKRPLPASGDVTLLGLTQEVENINKIA